MQKYFWKYMCYIPYLSSKIKSFFLIVVICFIFCVYDLNAKVIRKMDIPDWANKKHELYFKDVPIENILSFIVPDKIRIVTDSVSSDVKITVMGKYSVDELLQKYKEFIDYEYTDSSLILKGYIIKQYEIPYLPALYNSTQTYSATGGYYASTSATSQNVQTQDKTANIEYKMNIDFWNEIKQELKELLGAVDIDVVDVVYQPAQKPFDSSTFMKQPQNQQLDVKRKSKPKNFVTINKASGLIIVGCSVEKIRKVDAYIDSVKQKLSESVEVDFTLVEIKDKKSVSTGISWQSVLKTILFENNRFFLTPDDQQGFTIETNNLRITKNSSFSISAFGGDKQKIIIDALKEVADIKIVTKTNLLLKNNTTVGFNSGTITTFIDSLQNTSTTTSTTGTVSYTVTKGSVLSGIDMVISASVNGDNITMSVIPTISSLVDLQKIEFGDNLIVQNPTVEMKKSVATVTVKDGETTAIVGYNLNNKSNTRESLPLLGDIPIIGLLFSRNSVIDENSSLVILLTPKIKKTRG